MKIILINIIIKKNAFTINEFKLSKFVKFRISKHKLIIKLNFIINFKISNRIIEIIILFIKIILEKNNKYC